jgi:sulfate transport system permease protein
VLGASRLFTFRRIILRAIVPAMLTGFALAFARAVGEYGSIVFISGNMPLETEIVPLLHRHQARAVPVQPRPPRWRW